MRRCAEGHYITSETNAPGWGEEESTRPADGGIAAAFVRSLSAGLTFALCILLSALVRYDFSLSEPNFTGIALCSAVGLVAFLVLGPVLVFRGRFPHESGDELVAMGAVLALASGVMYLGNALTAGPVLVPTSVPVTASALTVVLVGLTGRMSRRMSSYRRARAGRSKRALILGAGSLGLTAFRLIEDDPHREHSAVGFLDDDPGRGLLRVNGLRVLGGLNDLETVLADHAVDVVIIAMRTLPPSRLDSIVDAARRAHVEIKVLPELDVYDLRQKGASGGSSIATRPGAFRPVEIDDLIGRKPISTDVVGIAGYLRDKTILVTGAGGSIGSHLCKQLARFSPRRVVMTDRDESGLHSTQLVLEGSALLTSEDLVLGDLRDVHFVRSLVENVRPDIIFHAAALKHLTFLERYPDEAIMTNVGASMSLLDAAVECGVPQFVHISTDKAADPSSVLGSTKYLTERAVAAIAQKTGLAYMSVRFGNVLGSRGSVLGTFVAQAHAGGPLTVTAPGVKRYFMSADEACELVLQAGALGRPGETLVLDMGEPVSIEDLARRVIALSGRTDVEIRYTGLREGEKFEEVRLGAGEEDVRPQHPLITQVAIPPVSLSLVRGLTASARLSGHRRNGELVEALRRAVTSGTDHLDIGLTKVTDDKTSAPRPPRTAPLTLSSILDQAERTEGSE